MSQASQISQISQLCQGRSWSGVTNFTKSGSQWHCQCVKSGLSQAFQISQTSQISQLFQYVPPDRVASTSYPDCLKHPRIAQLSATQLSSEQLNIWCIQHSRLHSRGTCNLNDADQWLLQFVGLDAADEEGIAFAESFHQQVRRLLELWRQGHLGGEQFCRNVTSVGKFCNFVKKCDKCWKSWQSPTVFFLFVSGWLARFRSSAKRAAKNWGLLAEHWTIIRTSTLPY